MTYVNCPAGSMVAGGRRDQDPSGHQVTAGGDVFKSEPGAAGGGAHHVLRQPSLLRAHPGNLSHRSDDAHHSTHATWLSARLCAQTKAEHQLQGVAQLVHSDSQGLLFCHLLNHLSLHWLSLSLGIIYGTMVLFI